MQQPRIIISKIKQVLYKIESNNLFLQERAAKMCRQSCSKQQEQKSTLVIKLKQENDEN